MLQSSVRLAAELEADSGRNDRWRMSLVIEDPGARSAYLEQFAQEYRSWST
jgi:hypothetical protein